MGVALKTVNIQIKKQILGIQLELGKKGKTGKRKTEGEEMKQVKETEGDENEVNQEMDEGKMRRRKS